MFLNPGNAGFASSVRSSVYVDKTQLLEFTNQILGTEQRFVCVSRPRRFGKSMAAKMLAAYYSRGCDSYDLFKNYKIAQSPLFENELNRHSVIYLDIQWFWSVVKDKGFPEQIVSYIQTEVIKELCMVFSDIVFPEHASLAEVLLRIHSYTDEQFIIIIDEWDCLFREVEDNAEIQEIYINFLRGIFKGVLAESSVQLAYLTGILPIKKYGTQSALNNFDEYTMISPVPLESYVGFTEKEAEKLCRDYSLDFDEMKQWYDGYVFDENVHIYNPKSVLEAVRRKRFSNYWTQTETYESLKKYIEMDFDGLKDAVIIMLGGGRCRINTQKFQNDMTNIKSRDDVMTLLIHLGYLAYDEGTEEVFIPNQEVAGEFQSAIEDGGWAEIAKAIKTSEARKGKTMEKKRYAVITGASAGIGMEFARRLAKKGFPLVLIARRRDRLEKLAGELGTKCEIIEADLSKEEECYRVFYELKEKKTGIFINNAGFGDCGRFEETDLAKEMNMVQLNVKALHILMKLMLKKMRKEGYGYILNVASSAGLMPAGPYMATYYATKSYVTSLTQAVAQELKESRSPVYVGCLCPGPVDTEFNSVANVEFALKGISAGYCADYALKQMARRQVVIIPTRLMQAAMLAGRFLPVPLYVRIAAHQQRKKFHQS